MHVTGEFEFLRRKLKVMKNIRTTFEEIFYSVYNNIKYHKSDVEMCFGDKNSDVVFYVIRRKGDKLGLLSFFNTHLGHINYAISKGYVPIVDMKNYENIYLDENETGLKNSWEYYFNQPMGNKYTLDEVYQSKRVIFGSMDPIEPRPDDDMDFLLDKFAHRYWHDLYCKYCSVNNMIRLEVDKYYEEEFAPRIRRGRKILGVFLRGTDYQSLRPYGHPIQPNIEEAVIEVNKAMEEWGCTSIYLVSEDSNIIFGMKEKLNYEIFRYNSQIYQYSGTGNISDASGNPRENDRFEHGKEYLISVYLLTKCNCFVGGRTSGTVAMHVMSEGFEHERFLNYGRYQTAEYKDKVI
jgi:hypothetical protein